MSKAEEGYAPLMSAKLAKERGQVLKQGLVGFAMIIVAVWSLLSIYWGSLYQIEKFFPRIAVDVYDLDQGGLLGPAVTRTLSQISQTPSKPHFTYRIVDNVTGVTLQDIEQRTVDERSWLAVVINANASSAFESAVAGTGGLVNGQYMPEGAISIVYANGRFFQVVVTYLTPQAQLDLEVPLLEAGMAATSQALQQFDTPSQYAALSESQRQALAYPFSYQNIDVRPIKNNQWASAAPLEAGLIYYIIFAFHVTLFLYFTRAATVVPLQKKGMRISHTSAILVRLVPLVPFYFFLSLWFSLLNVAFQVPMNGNGHSGLNSQSGFMVFWMVNLLTLFALGLAMEAMITVLTIKFFPLFLSVWIIFNITSSFFPISLMSIFYRWGYAMPFFHATTAYKYIFFGARNRIGLNFGVLTAWAVLSLCTTALFEVAYRKKHRM